MIALPEKMRKELEKTVRTLNTKRNAYGVGLFGSACTTNETEATSKIEKTREIMLEVRKDTKFLMEAQRAGASCIHE